MFYPVYIHKDDDSAWGATFADFPGCFTAADDLADLPRLAQEAVEVYFDGETDAIPAPTTPDQWVNDDRFVGGYWMLIDIDLSKVSTRAVRLNISLPENLLTEIDKYATKRHMTRSAFLAAAAINEMHESDRNQPQR